MKKTGNSIYCKILSAAALVAALLAASPAFAILGQPVPGGIDLQASASPIKDKMITFHDGLLLPITAVIAAFVLLLLLIVIIRFNAKANPIPSRTTHHTMLEVVWTLIPVLILIVIAVRSLPLLYYFDKSADTALTVKAVGSQWYWSYEYPDNGGFTFTSNLVQDKDLKPGQPRLLATDNPMVVPVHTKIKLLTAATDVIHSWAVPALGIKLDAIPGRLNETWLEVDKEGTFYGQCSQLCGQGHAYMPIEVKAVSPAAFAEWVKKQGGKAAGAEPPAAKAKSKKTKKTGEQ